MGNKKRTAAGDLTNGTHLNFKIIIRAAAVKQARSAVVLITFLIVWPDSIFSQLESYTTTWSWSPATPKPSVTALEAAPGWQEQALILLRLCPRYSPFHTSSRPFTAGWQGLGKIGISWDCRQGYFSGLQKKGSSSKHRSMYIATTALFTYKLIVNQRNWKITAIYLSLALPPTVPLLAKQPGSSHCFKFNARRWFYLEFALLVRHVSSLY